MVRRQPNTGRWSATIYPKRSDYEYRHQGSDSFEHYNRDPRRTAKVGRDFPDRASAQHAAVEWLMVSPEGAAFAAKAGIRREPDA
jgi:hypothetical protein